MQILDAPTNEFIEKLAVELQNVEEINPPEWAKFVKTGVHKERAPARKDWWFVRCAAIFRSVYKLGPVGVSRLRIKYGGKKNNGVAPEHHYDASGNIIRKMLQQLEKAGFIEQITGLKKGRIVTAKGKDFLQKIADKIKE